MTMGGMKEAFYAKVWRQACSQGQGEIKGECARWGNKLDHGVEHQRVMNCFIEQSKAFIVGKPMAKVRPRQNCKVENVSSAFLPLLFSRQSFFYRCFSGLI